MARAQVCAVSNLTPFFDLPLVLARLPMRDEQKISYLQHLTEKCHDRRAVIGIVGLGYRVFR